MGLKKIFLVIVLALVVVGGGFLFLRSRRGASSSAYQAVSLTNNQVYYGKIAQVSSNYLVLTDVYYLVDQSRLQQTPQATDSAQPRYRLAKLGEAEAHKPENELIINRSNIIAISEMKADSTVVQGINERKKQESAK